jgi:hypothetical protein
MPIFRVRGVRRPGRSFTVRFEAPTEGDLRAMLDAEGVEVEAVRRVPCTAWPFSRLPWMILVLPLLCYGLSVCALRGVQSGLELRRETRTQAAYERLAREGVTTTGSITVERTVGAKHGSPRRELEYAFRCPDGSLQRGALVAGSGDVATGRHDLRLEGDAPLREGSELTVTYLRSQPSVHAPFVVDGALLARHRQVVGGEWRKLGALLLLAPLFAWMVFNVAMRTGSHYEHRERPRIVEIVQGDSLLAGPEEEEEEGDEDGAD